MTDPDQAGRPSAEWIDQLPACVAMLVGDTVRYANPAALRLLRARQPSDVIGREVDVFIHPLDLHRALARLRHAEGGGINPVTEIRAYTCDGQPLMLAMSSAIVVVDDERAVLASFLDMTERAAMEQRLRQTDEDFQRMMNTMQDVFYRTDAQGITRYVCPAVKNVLGYTAEEIIGLPAAAFYPDPSERDALVAEIRKYGAVHDFPGRMRRKDGVIIDISISTQALRDEQGEYAGVEGIWRDISERKALERRLEHLATFDSLTGIHNRSSILGILERLLRRRAPLSVLLLDLDYFKRINDGFGHAAGDRVLCRFVQIIEGEKRSRDFFGRLGGEEFLLILDGADEAEAGQIAERLRAAVSAEAIALAEGEAVALTVSIGMTQSRPGDQRTADVLVRADRALYRAKQMGRNCVCGESSQGGA
ncbi:MAG: diguanylate cyclase [Betaproteobacteria bacterium]|nr:diguanylate cyclase [Betaproteobacteria bacterium]